MQPSADVNRLDVTGRDAVVWLDDPGATDPGVTGAKAANLARAASAGLRVLPGFVVTTAATALGSSDPSVQRAVIAALSMLVEDDDAVVVRSSSTIEDAGTSSMAGRFTSVLDVRGAEALIDAIGTVITSSDRVRDGDGRAQPIAVLVQRQLDTSLGGVMFGVDPVTGRRDHIVVEVVHCAPDALVGGRVSAEHFVLDQGGSVVDHVVPQGAPSTRLDRRRRRELVHLAALNEMAFGGPQDVEWAVDRTGTLWLLQARPVTAVAAGPDAQRDAAPVLGPGPLAETFPAPLAPLEVDLWLSPMREGMRRALVAAGAAQRATVDRSPIIVEVNGRPAVDLSLIGALSTGSRWQRLKPRVLLRRLATAWRIGRLRVALPSIAAGVAAAVDDDLSTIGTLAAVSDSGLVELLHRTRSELATVHSVEMLCGMIDHAAPDRSHVPLPTVAIHAAARLRSAGLDDDAIIEHAPECLALTVPVIGSPVVVPPLPATAPGDTGRSDPRPLTHRDELRLRIRWLQELGARVANEIGRRAADRGFVDDPAHIRWSTLADIDRPDAIRLSTEDVAARAAALSTDPLPTRFRLVGGDVRSLAHQRHSRAVHRHATTLHGLPASVGRSTGVVVHSPPNRGSAEAGPVVLVTEHLEPGLATALPALTALVAETGSALSHLAILAREAHLPTVVAVPEARRCLPCGTRVVVDGARGVVHVLDEPTDRGAGDR